MSLLTDGMFDNIIEFRYHSIFLLHCSLLKGLRVQKLRKKEKYFIKLEIIHRKRIVLFTSEKIN